MIVRPGVTTRKPRVNLRLLGCRTALMVCHAMIMAITVVLPAPVASFNAMRSRSGLASLLTSANLSRILRSAGLSLGATSDSQITVSTASTWQKNGRKLLNLCCRQCNSSLAVSGVTPQLLGPGMFRHSSTLRRTSFTAAVTSYCCSRVEIPIPSSISNRCWPDRALPLCLGLGIGEMNSAPRLLSIICWVGWPSWYNSQWRFGYS